jgi:hypothetical protein
MAGVFFWHGFDTCRPDAADKKGKGKGKGKYFVGGRGGEERTDGRAPLHSNGCPISVPCPIPG